MTYASLGPGPHPGLAGMATDPIAALLAMQPETGMLSPGTPPETPFVWGAGGARKTPEQLASEREIAQALAMGNYSPVQHWTQGLGRVLDNVEGAIDLRRLDREQAESQAAIQAQIAAALGPQNADVAGLIGTGDKGAISIADNVLASRKPAAPTEIEKLGALAGWTPERIAQAAGKIIQNREDPIITGVMGGQSYAGPQSWVLNQFQGGGGQTSGAGGGSSPSPPRPAGADDATLKRQALEAVRNGANIDEVMARLQAWGVRP